MIFDPTPDGWKSFRDAIANIPNLKDGEFFPIMGNFQYQITRVAIDAERTMAAQLSYH